jgi:hypothetical protein
LKTKNKYYGIYSKNDNFLYGVFPLSKEGYKKASEYISKINFKDKNQFIIKKK